MIPRAFSGAAPLAPIGLLVLMGCVQIAAPYVLLSYGLRRVSGVEASLLALVEPLLSPVWVALFISETPTAATVAGGALIVVALGARYTLFRSRDASD
jgi:drug/metabolite transporter (DMT)-like permease